MSSFVCARLAANGAPMITTTAHSKAIGTIPAISRDGTAPHSLSTITETEEEAAVGLAASELDLSSLGVT